jgi:integrase
MLLLAKNLPDLEAKFAALQEAGKKDHIFFDGTVEGFGLRFRAGGKRVWVLQYKRGGRQTRLTLGPLSVIDPVEARAMAKRELGKVWQGDDPAAKKRDRKARDKVTLRIIIDQYLASKQSKLAPRSLREARRYLLEKWKPLHGWPIDRITRAQIANILTDLEAEAPVAAALARSNLSTLYFWAMQRGYVDHNAVVGTFQPSKSKTRERVLDDAELRAVWAACDQDDDYSAVIRLLILTGCRREEIGDMAWQELNRDKQTWTLPGARSKNKCEHSLVLPPLAWEVLDGIKRRPGVDHLFGRAGGFNNWANRKAGLDERCSIEKPWTVHDIRRSVATGMADLGIAPHVVESVLNHKRRGIAGVYNRGTYAAEKAQALALWADHVREIVTGIKSNVHQLRSNQIPA